MDINNPVRDGLFAEFGRQVLDKGWAHVNCAEIATASDIEVKLAFVEFRNRYAYVTELVRRIDAQMLANSDMTMGEEPARERLFDVLMTRFDAMQEYKPLIVALNRAAKKDPLLSLHLLALSRLTTDWIMDIVRISPSGFMGIARSKGALAAYGRAFMVWLEDDSEDMAKTMSCLDKTLRKGERALQKGSKVLDKAGKIACALPRLRRKCRKGRASSSAKKGRDHDDAAPVVDDGDMAPMPS